MANNLIELCGLWEGKDSHGGYMLTGSLGWQGKIMILENHNRRDRQPPFKLYITRKTKGKPGKAKQEPEDDLPF